MAFIRNKNEERTCYQTSSLPIPEVDNQCDTILVAGLNSTAKERIEIFRSLGYVVHFFTGISWGNYMDYLSGEFDGTEHWDESQTDRYGNRILHGLDSPYICPSIAFADYLTEKLKAVVDAGVEAIHVEEPEFWDRAGYSEAFKREFELYYRKPWTPPHESVDAKYKCAKLKAYLFTRTIDRVSSGIKEYAKRKHNKDLRFYVPTHSLLNYTQWKIVSPEGKLTEIPSLDGCIAQVWTGTSREKNWFNGVLKERTFETAYLEYGVMQELVSQTGRKMWFLHDPIEDNPMYDWDDYRYNYLCTVAASLLHGNVNEYEICPWPNRVFEGEYPSGSPNATGIPESYKTLLNNNFNTLGTIEKVQSEGLRVGVLVGDGQLYQREYPDFMFNEQAKEEVGTVLRDSEQIEMRVKEELADGKTDRELLLRHMSSSSFPGFYSLALPLLKYGIPLRPVLIDNARKYTGYLDNYDVLVMSYEYTKPDYPDINATLAAWVRNGGVLIYAGDGFDPFNGIDSWWSKDYSSPAEHLFDMLEIEPVDEKTTYKCGKGAVGVWKTNPALIGVSKMNADSYRAFFDETIGIKGYKADYKNHLIIKRNEYIIADVMDESISDEPLVLKGLYANMFSEDFEICRDVTVKPGENAVLLDFGEIADEPLRIIGTSVRVFSMEQKVNAISLEIQGAGNFDARMRIKTPFEVTNATVDGESCSCLYDAESKTVLLKFKSITGKRSVKIY